MQYQQQQQLNTTTIINSSATKLHSRLQTDNLTYHHHHQYQQQQQQQMPMMTMMSRTLTTTPSKHQQPNDYNIQSSYTPDSRYHPSLPTTSTAITTPATTNTTSTMMNSHNNNKHSPYHPLQQQHQQHYQNPYQLQESACMIRKSLSPIDNQYHMYKGNQQMTNDLSKRSITPELARPTLNTTSSTNNITYCHTQVTPTRSAMRNPNTVLPKADEALKKPFPIQDEISPALNKSNHLSPLNYINSLPSISPKASLCLQTQQQPQSSTGIMNLHHHPMHTHNPLPHHLQYNNTNGVNAGFQPQFTQPQATSSTVFRTNNFPISIANDPNYHHQQHLNHTPYPHPQHLQHSQYPQQYSNHPQYPQQYSNHPQHSNHPQNLNHPQYPQHPQHLQHSQNLQQHYEYPRDVSHSKVILTKADEMIKKSSNLRSNICASPFRGTTERTTTMATINNTASANANANASSITTTPEYGSQYTQSNPGYPGGFRELVTKADEALRKSHYGNPAANSRAGTGTGLGSGFGGLFTPDKAPYSTDPMLLLMPATQSNPTITTTPIKKKAENHYTMQSPLSIKKPLQVNDENAYENRPNFFQNPSICGNKSGLPASNTRNNVSPIKNIQDTKDLMSKADKILRCSSQNRLAVGVNMITKKNDCPSPLGYTTESSKSGFKSNKLESPIPNDKFKFTNQLASKTPCTSHNQSTCSNSMAFNTPSQLNLANVFNPNIVGHTSNTSHGVNGSGKYVSYTNISLLEDHFDTPIESSKACDAKGIEDNIKPNLNRKDIMFLKPSNGVGNGGNGSTHDIPIDLSSFPDDQSNLINTNTPIDMSDYQTNASVQTRNFASLAYGPGTCTINPTNSNSIVHNNNINGDNDDDKDNDNDEPCNANENDVNHDILNDEQMNVYSSIQDESKKLSGFGSSGSGSAGSNGNNGSNGGVVSNISDEVVQNLAINSNNNPNPKHGLSLLKDKTIFSILSSSSIISNNSHHQYPQHHQNQQDQEQEQEQGQQHHKPQQQQQHKNQHHKQQLNDNTFELNTIECSIHTISSPNLSLSKDDKKVNYIEEILADGTRYIGEKYNDYRHGQGQYFYSNGTYYLGDWQLNKRYGYGILYDKYDNIIYDGEWLDDKYHGNGILYNEQQPHHQGQDHQHDQDQGHNVEQAPFGNDIGPNVDITIDHIDLNSIGNEWYRYEGEFFCGKKHGLGTLYIQYGYRFIGNYKNDLAHGRGRFYYNEQIEVNGNWENNKFVCEE